MTRAKTVSAALVAAALTVLSLGVFTAQGSSPERAEASARKASLYLVRASFDSPTRQGVIETLSRINGNAVPIQMDLLISVHGLQPDLTYRVVGSRQPCSQASVAAEEIFDVELAPTPGTDRFLKQNSMDAGFIPKHMKSARLFLDNSRIGCIGTKLYTVARYP
jgi:hypothetical protein